MKRGDGSVTICAAISSYSAGPLITLHYRIIASDYVKILGKQLHPMVQMLFPNNNVIFQGDDSPIRSQKCSVSV
jgi:hypothetical protein